jgi:hypothetical protein
MPIEWSGLAPELLLARASSHAEAGGRIIAAEPAGTGTRGDQAA